MEVSVLSYGAAGLGRIYGTADEPRGIRTVHEALDRGINLIDTSPLYGGTKSEMALGKALRICCRFTTGRGRGGWWRTIEN